MKRLMEYTVLRELVTAWRLAASPTSRSPLLVNATTDGVVRLPSEFSRTCGSPPSMTAMQEFVVPKSMPNTFAIKSLKLVVCSLFPCNKGAQLQGTRQMPCKQRTELTFTRSGG